MFRDRGGETPSGSARKSRPKRSQSEARFHLRRICDSGSYKSDNIYLQEKTNASPRKSHMHRISVGGNISHLLKVI